MEAPIPLALIVAATDFSDGARAAFRSAADLAARSGASLHLVHAEAEDGARRRYAPDIRSTEGAVRAWATETVGGDRLEAVTFEPVVVRSVEPRAGLLQYVDRAGPDLLVMGTHGRRGPHRFLIGSVAERLVRFSPCPVLTVPYGSSAAAPGPDAPVLAPVDFSAATPDALAWAKRVAALYEAPLDLLHVVVGAVPVPHFYPLLQRPPLRPLLETTPELERRATGEMERVVDSAPGPRVEVRRHLRSGVPAVEIVRFAREADASLIVMGTQGLSGVEHFLLGSTAEQTVRTAPCAVLTTRRPEVEDPESGRAVSRSALATA